jgi:hypothetical protein
VGSLLEARHVAHPLKTLAGGVDSERDYKEKKRLIAQIVESEKSQGQQTRAENAKHKREVMASRRNAREVHQYAVS